MGDLKVRRNRSFAPPRYETTGKAEKQAGATPTRQAAAPKPGVAVAETLRQLAARLSQSAGQVQQAKRSLLGGEAALAEVQEDLGRMAQLAQKAAEGSAEDTDALQAQLEKLCGQVDRVIQSAVDAGFFQDAPPAGGTEGANDLPAWLLGGLTGTPPDKETLLAALGLPPDATGPELLAALSRLPLDENPASGYLASLYLGSVIAGSDDPAQAAEGLRQLLDAIAQGAAPDDALKSLTGGKFASLADFQEQFTAGTAPGLEPFLTGLLLPGDNTPSMPGLPPLLLPEGAGDGTALLLGLLASLEGLETLPVLGGEGTALPFPLPGAPHAPSQAAGQGQGQGPTPQGQALTLPGARAVGLSLSGAAFDPSAGTFTISGSLPLLLQGDGGQGPALRLTGPGMLALQGFSSPQLGVGAPQARLYAQGPCQLGQLHLAPGASLTVEGGGVLHVNSLHGGAGSTLRLQGAALALGEEASPSQPVPVVLGGMSFLLSTGQATVHTPQGEPVKPFDLLWKALVPGFNTLTSLAVDGRQVQMNLAKGGRQELARLWLPKGDPSQGFPSHTVILHGRDEAGRLRTRYVYLLWSQREGGFQQAPLYPNPFTVTGGEADLDWRYEEESQSLRILTGQVDAVSGGSGTDLNQQPFSGRLALADGIGPVSLILDGVACQVTSGRAFNLGRGNQVTLLLPDDTHNLFESGPGCAGISLGDGTSLCIDRVKGGAGTPGALTATGGAGSLGIGRDSGVGRQQTAPILIRGGTVTATGGAAESPKLRSSGSEPPPPLPLPHPPLQALGLNALDISTREAARSAVEALAAGKRRVAQIQGAYSALYSQLEQGPSPQPYRQALRDSGQAGDLLWDMRQSLLDAPLGSLSQGDLDSLFMMRR